MQSTIISAIFQLKNCELQAHHTPTHAQLIRHPTPTHPSLEGRQKGVTPKPQTHPHSFLTPALKPYIHLDQTMPRNIILPYRTDLKSNARKLRRKSTYAEMVLWEEIRRRRILGYQFHWQVPMLNYIVDFYCHELMLAIEVDGSSHWSAEAQRRDSTRQQRLESLGVRFLRFDDLRVKRDIDKVLEEIKNWIREKGMSCSQR